MSPLFILYLVAIFFLGIPFCIFYYTKEISVAWILVILYFIFLYLMLLFIEYHRDFDFYEDPDYFKDDD
jgi:hypothetical protein